MKAVWALLSASMFVLAAYAEANAQAVDVQAAPAWATGSSAPWLDQIAVNAAIETQANGGAGFNLAFVDTGVVETQMNIADRVSALSACAAISFSCSYGYRDDNGHGTATRRLGQGPPRRQGLEWPAWRRMRPSFRKKC